MRRGIQEQLREKIGDVKSEDGSLGISIGFEGSDDEDYEGSDFDEEITDFNNFSIDLEEDYEEDINFTHKSITLEDEKGHFYGDYNQSPNKKYIVAYDEGHLNENNEQVGGQVYLIENQKRILWKKILERPNAGFVTNKGEVIIIDWTSSDQLVGKLFIFSKQGKKSLEHKFNANIGGQDISPDGAELIVSTCFPENAIYLFDIEKTKLVKKVENTTKDRPLVNFDFGTIKSFVDKAPEFNQEDYNLQKKKEETELKEEQERIESLKKKNISELNYDELVTIASEYAGDFYGKLGEPRKALKYIMRAIELKKDKPQPYVLKLAGFCYEKLEKYKEAIKYYHWAIERYSQYKKSVVMDHIDFCNLKLSNKYKKDWTTYIVNKREKERTES